MAYTQEQKDEKFNEVCKRIAEGESVTSILRPGNNIISKPVFFEWLAEDKEKANQYARATEVRADGLFEQILVISDATAEDIIKDPDTGQIITNHNVIQRDRLRVDARKWILAKMNPKKYGDKQEIDHTTKGEAITSIRIIDVDGTEI